MWPHLSLNGFMPSFPEKKKIGISCASGVERNLLSHLIIIEGTRERAAEKGNHISAKGGKDQWPQRWKNMKPSQETMGRYWQHLHARCEGISWVKHLSPLSPSQKTSILLKCPLSPMYLLCLQMCILNILTYSWQPHPSDQCWLRFRPMSTKHPPGMFVQKWANGLRANQVGRKDSYSRPGKDFYSMLSFSAYL